MNHHRSWRSMARVGLLAAGALVLLVFVNRPSPAEAGLIVAGGPTYDATTGTGLRYGGAVLYAPGSGVNNSGVAVGNGGMYVSNSPKGSRGFRWDASGGAATELNSLDMPDHGYTITYVYAVSDAGIAVGYSRKHESGSLKGNRAVRWDASGNATELDNLGTDSGGNTYSEAIAVNDTGIAAGYADKYESGVNKGERAVRWDASGSVTELGHIGTDNNDYTEARAYAMNASGTAVGWAKKYVGGEDRGERAVRWDASGTVATELGALGTDPDGYAYIVRAYAVNDSGTAVGKASKDGWGERAVRWDASGTVATELDHLGTYEGYTYSAAYAVNASGAAVGYAWKYDGESFLGSRAVRWDASGTAATELATLGTDHDGYTDAEAYAVNDAGTAVGYLVKYESGNYVGNRAVIWLPDASAIDLNDLGLMDAVAGGTWVLISANALSSDGWVAGTGSFTPTDGSSYNRLFVTQVGLGGAWTDAFTGSLDGVWGRGNQWTTGTPAMTVGDAVFDVNAAYTVSLDRNELTRSITITAGTVTLDFQGHTLGSENGLTLTGAGTLKGSGIILGDVIQTGGRLAAGNSPGIMAIGGDYALEAGVLEIELAGDGNVAGVNFDFYDIAGAATLAGTLEILNWDDFLPTDGQTFDVLTALTINTTGLTLTGLDGFSHFIISGGNGQVLQLRYTVPEPASAVMLALSCAGLLLRRGGSRAW